MTRNKCYLTEYEDYDGGFVSFGDGKGRIFGKYKIKTGTLDFDNVYFYNELKYNLFSVSQICDKNNNVLFTDTECLVLSSDFKLLDESQVLLRVPRKDNIYSVDLKSVVPTKGLTCLFAKATIDESNLWHRRLGHINFKNMNKLVRGNLVRGLPSKIFENDHSCVACQKEKQHKASCKAKLLNSISKPLHTLHMDLFGLTNVKSLMKKSYCLVVTDDFNYKVKAIRSDNGTEFKNSVMNQFCEMKGIKREFSVARTPQQNGVAERRNRTLIEAARTMLVDSKLPTTFWAEAVNTACYVLNRVLVIKPHNKTPYELIHGRTPLIDFMKPFGCPVTILNTRDHLGKFDGKADEGFFVGYSVIFDVDSLTISMNYVPVVAGNQTNGIAGTRDNIITGYTQEEGIDYDEVFAPVARIEAIRLFLAYASFMGFIVYQMVVKSAFLYGTIEEEVYVCQPPGFEDPHFPDKVYKVEKALYGLHQTPRAWYETLSTYLIENRFKRFTIDKTLFIKKDKGDILLVQVYVDDIIFGFTKKSLCDEFEGLMHKRFQMSSMGELTFFLGLQVQQKEDGIFISQDKYVAEILKKFDFATVKIASTPIETNKALVKDEEAKAVDVHLYKSMFGSLMYLTASRPDIMFAVCACARFQVTPKTSYIHAVKRIFRYLKGQPKLGLWYHRDSPFDFETFSDSDYAGASLDRKSTIREYVAAANCCGQDETVYKVWGRVKREMPATTTSSLDVEQDSSGSQVHVYHIGRCRNAQTKIEAAS
ncbi:putative ribonuclease H-like domain-containing protein [Tanacetum coccineum]